MGQLLSFVTHRMVESLSKQLTQSTELGSAGIPDSQGTVDSAGGRIDTRLAVQEVRVYSCCRGCEIEIQFKYEYERLK